MARLDRRCVALALALSSFPALASAQASLRTWPGDGPLSYGAACLGMNDDGSSNVLSLAPIFPSGLRFFSQTQTQTYINTNGNITFAGALPTFTPNPFPVANQPMIAPFWADVDTRTPRAAGGCNGPGNGVAVMGPACDNPTGGDGIWWHSEAGLLAVTWDRVGYYLCHQNHRMSFQLILTAVAPACGSTVAGTDFDVEFRYHQCEWETGDASSGTNGFGGTPAQAGFDEGIGTSGHFYAIPGSRAAGISAHLCTGSNTVPAQPGIWQFQVRNGVVMTCPNAGMACMVPGQMGVCAQGRLSCAAGSSTPTCVQQVTPNAERCDNLDNDCNGLVDDSSSGNLCGSLEVCQMGACVDGCFEGSCPPGYTCDMSHCVDAMCVGVTCPDGQRCVMGACVDPCAGVTCPSGQMCTGGRCVDPCTGITCDDCTACVGGSCVTRCTASSCAAGQTCTSTGVCVDSACATVTCDPGTYCMAGACVDACTGVTCPSGEACMAGECIQTDLPDAAVVRDDVGPPPQRDAAPQEMDAGSTPSDADIPGDTGRHPIHTQSCGCSAAGSRPPSELLALVGLGLVIASRRRRR